jgi:hypothetical protein
MLKRIDNDYLNQHFSWLVAIICPFICGFNFWLFHRIEKIKDKEMMQIQLVQTLIDLIRGKTYIATKTTNMEI